MNGTKTKYRFERQTQVRREATNPGKKANYIPYFSHENVPGDLMTYTGDAKRRVIIACRG